MKWVPTRLVLLSILATVFIFSFSALAGAADLQGKIVFVRDGDIWVMSVDGSNQKQLSFTGKARSPSWSPDGERIVYLDESNTFKQVNIYNLRSGSNQVIEQAETWGSTPNEPPRFLSNKKLFYMNRQGAGPSLANEIYSTDLTSNSQAQPISFQDRQLKYELIQEIEGFDITPKRRR